MNPQTFSRLRKSTKSYGRSRRFFSFRKSVCLGLILCVLMFPDPAIQQFPALASMVIN